MTWLITALLALAMLLEITYDIIVEMTKIVEQSQKLVKSIRKLLSLFHKSS